MGFWGLGFGVWGLGFGDWGLVIGDWGLGFGVWGLGFGVWGLGMFVNLNLMDFRYYQPFSLACSRIVKLDGNYCNGDDDDDDDDDDDNASSSPPPPPTTTSPSILHSHTFILHHRHNRHAPVQG